MADYKPEDVSDKYLASLENLPTEEVLFGLFLFVLVLGVGHFLNTKYKRWSFKRRQAKRRQALQEKEQGTTRGRRRNRR